MKQAAIFGSNTQNDSVNMFVRAWSSGLRELGYMGTTFNLASKVEYKIIQGARLVVSDVDEPLERYRAAGNYPVVKCGISGSPQIDVELRFSDEGEDKKFSRVFGLVEIASGEASRWINRALSGEEPEQVPHPTPQPEWPASVEATAQDEAIVEGEPELMDVVSVSQSMALRVLGIGTVGELANADPVTVSQARGIGESRAERMIEKAKAALTRT